MTLSFATYLVLGHNNRVGDQVTKHGILILEPSKVLREGLCLLLSKKPQIEVVGSTDNAYDAIQHVRMLKPTLVLIEIQLAGKVSGIEAIKQIKKQFPKTRILVMTVTQSEEDIRASFRAGADGYISKNSTHAELEVALKNVLAGHHYISPLISKKVIEEYLIGKKTSRVILQKRGAKGDCYVDKSRIRELKAIPKSKFDLSKLIRILEEMNLCHKGQCHISSIMLTRALIDHVPPIFSCKTFSEVSNNYAGTKSFRESMLHLENSSRKIADQHLHSMIREKESLPNKTQVNFSNDIDVLLSEIARVLK